MAALIIPAGLGLAFGPAGWLIGSLISNMLNKPGDPGPGPAPKIQGSQYGAMIPIPYGTIRIWSPQVVWQDKWTSHKHSSGGKGGLGVTTYTWSTSWALKVCKNKYGGIPIDGVLRIWANGEIVYDVSAGSSVDNSQVPVTIYLGDPTSNPDPTMEAKLGVGNVPAFRDDVALVFTDRDCGKFGNTLPQISVEVFTSGDSTPIPWRVNYIRTSPPFNTPPFWWQSGAGSGDKGLMYTGDGKVRAYAYTGGFASYWEDNWKEAFITNVSPIPDPDRPGVAGAPCVFDGGGRGVVEAIAYGINCCYCVNNSNTGWAAWFVGSGQGTIIKDHPDGSGGGPHGSYVADSVQNEGVYDGFGGIWAAWKNNVTGAFGIAKWSPGGSFGNVIPLDSVLPLGVTATSIKFGCSEVGDVFVGYADTSPGTHGDGLIWLSAAGATKFFWNNSDPAHSTPATFTVSHGFCAYHNYIASEFGSGPVGTRFFKIWHIDAVAFTITGGGAISEYASFSTRAYNGFVLMQDGVASLDSTTTPGPITLASIVEDITLRAGLVAGQYDVSQLTDIVDGYLITQQQAGRNDIEPLRSAYFFDGVENSGMAKFVKRGQAPAVTIPDNDLAAQEPNQAPPPYVKIERVQEVDLPAVVNVKYLNSGAAYQPGNQVARMQTTFSESTSVIDVQIAMSDAKANQVGYTLLRSAWVERMKATFWTSRKYDYLEPTDVVTAHGYIIRIMRKTERVVGILEFEGVLNIPALYNSGPIGNPTSGGGQPVAPSLQSTDLLLFDIAMITDSDIQTGFYAAAAGSVDDTWTGYRLFQSTDGGTTFTNVATQTVPSVIAACSTTLPDFEGGNVFDECSTLTVVVGAGGGELANAAQDAVLNGANFALVGDPVSGYWEILQFKNATLTAPSTYALSGFLRGRRGTEWAIPLHGAAETFVLMPAVDVDMQFSQLGLLLDYKPVSIGSSLAGTTQVPFTNTGQALRPYSPSHIIGAPITPFDGTVQIAWQRRTRIGGAWLNFADVPLSEPNETYVVQFWNSTFTVCARTVIVTANNSYTYSAASQVTDYGQVQQHIYVSVGQLGSYTLGRQTTATLPGSGGSDTSPASPVTPYNGFLPTQ